VDTFTHIFFLSYTVIPPTVFVIAVLYIHVYFPLNQLSNLPLICQIWQANPTVCTSKLQHACLHC